MARFVVRPAMGEGFGVEESRIATTRYYSSGHNVAKPRSGKTDLRVAVAVS